MRKKIIALWKRLLSYTKSNWNLEDYPLYFRNNDNNEVRDKDNLLEIKDWYAGIVNLWFLDGYGDTKEEAYQMLKTNFENYRNQNKLPRPGIFPPLQFADNTEINTLIETAVPFFEKILDINFYECFISDESSVYGFLIEDDEIIQKINLNYNLGLTDLGDGNIVRILKMIKNKEESK